MNFDLEDIVERLYVATDTTNNRQLAAFLGRSHSAINGWKTKKSPPFEDIWLVHEKTGYDYYWLLTGTEPSVSKKPEIEDYLDLKQDYKNFQRAIKDSLRISFDLGYIARTNKTREAEEVLSRLVFAKYKNIDLAEADNILDAALERKAI